MTTTPNMLLVLPDLGASIGVWDDLLNTLLPLVDLHDHSTGKGVKITPSGLNINADLSLIGTSAITNAKAIQFTAAASYTVARSLFVLSSDNELYWRTNGGTNVKLTNGTSINMSLVGGIYGDYSTTSAKIYYEDAGKRYKMLQSGPAPDFWAAVDCGDLKLYEKASAISNAVTLKSPATLAASYSLTMPAALPAATALLQVSSAGVISTNVTGTRSPGFFTTMEASGVVSLGTLVAAFTATAAITATAFRWTSNLEHNFPVSLAQFDSTLSFNFTNDDYVELNFSTETSGIVIPIVLPAGCRITSIDVYVNKTTNATKTITSLLRRTVGTTGALSTIATLSTSANAPGYTSFGTGAVSHDVDSNSLYTIHTEGSGTTGDALLGVRLQVTKPA